ncbi:MAG: ATP-dependent DNA helicase [Alphaproteobacteria bacterium]
MNPPSSPPRTVLPEVPVLVTGVREAVLLFPDSRQETWPLAEAIRRMGAVSPMLCHARAVAGRLRVDGLPAHDVLELFAFVRPARFCLPTVRGLAEALGFERPEGLVEEARVLVAVVRRLLWHLSHLAGREGSDARTVAWAMARGGWVWGPSVLAALGVSGDGPHRLSATAGLRVWDRMPRWEEFPPEPKPGHLPVEPLQARRRLALLLGPGAEERPQQADYASSVAAAFVPREQPGTPSVVLAEAGTGVGKTLGYIAAASLWAQKNRGAVWLSTYTRTLQRQLDGELDRLFPDPEEKDRKVVVRKGRENYLCLLNMEEAVQRLQARPGDAVALGLMARWALSSRDGDFSGSDFPGWLVDLLGRDLTVGLADRRGECLFAACLHYPRCPIERNARRARRAELVIVNHALVMVHTALGTLSENDSDEATLPTRFVFDEGHHVFDAADSAFSAHLTGLETAELRRWLLGAEGEGSRSRSRGLQARIADLVEGVEAAVLALDEAVKAARILPGPGWHQRLAGNAPQGPTERFLALARTQVLARDGGAADSPYSLETETNPLLEALPAEAAALNLALGQLDQPLSRLCGLLMRRLDDEASELEADQRNRIDAMVRGIERRALLPIGAWRAMLQGLGHATPPEFVDWFAVERAGGREVDVGMHRHWLDPTRPFAMAITAVAHGLLVTSATLRDASGDVEADWLAAERRTGASHFPSPAIRAAVPSPFDYPSATRVLVVTDVRKDDLDQVAAAYRELFLAAGGGGLGLFTAISRLRAVQARIAAPLEAAGVPLLAQHVDAMDIGTLVEIFRAEEDACLLGTDAVRDGVDVPGRSLRLIVFDRVPWPRPDILYRARRAALGSRGGRNLDDTLTRLRLKQAFGRLIRQSGDRGVFVILDPRMPSRLVAAFPDGVEPRRLGLKAAIADIRQFLGEG